MRKLRPSLWEVRVRLDDRTARVLFTLVDDEAVLLHGFIKKSQKTPTDELATATARMKRLHEAPTRSQP